MQSAVLVRTRGEQVLLVLLALGLLTIAVGLVLGEALVPLVFVLLLLGGAAIRWTIKYDHRALIALIISFAAVARYEEGFQVEELLYAFLFFGFLGYWFLRKISVNVDSLVQSRVDLCLLLYLLYATFSLSLSLINGAEVVPMVGEYYSLTMMLIYFPLRQVFSESREVGRTILYSLLALAVIIALRNFWLYFLRMQTAEQLWQLATGRVVMNEHVLMPSAVACVALYLTAHSRLSRSVLFAVLSILVAGIIIGQSRALWLSFALALAVLFFASRRAEKRTILRTSVFGSILLVGGVIIVLGPDLFTLIAAGLLDRLFSLESAVTDDVSLVNRFNEIKTVFNAAITNPIVGHGMGVPYKYYSMVYVSTHETSFVHNGYLHLFYRHGVVGLVLFGGFFLGAMWNALKVLLDKAAGKFDRAAGVTALAVFSAILLSANSESPFGTSDKTFMLAIIAALAVGTACRRRREIEVDR